MIPKIYAEERAKLLDDINGLRVEKDEKKRVGTLIFDRAPMNISILEIGRRSVL